MDYNPYYPSDSENDTVARNSYKSILKPPSMFHSTPKGNNSIEFTVEEMLARERKLRYAESPIRDSPFNTDILTCNTSSSYQSESNLESLDKTLNAHLEHDTKLMDSLKTVNATLTFMDESMRMIKKIEEQHSNKVLGDYEASINIYRLGHDLLYLRKRFYSIINLEFGETNQCIELKKLEKKFKKVMERAQLSHLNMNYRTYDELGILNLGPEDLQYYFDDANEEFHKGRKNHPSVHLRYYNQQNAFNIASRRLHIFDKIIYKIISNQEYNDRFYKRGSKYLDEFIYNNYNLNDLVAEYSKIQKMKTINDFLNYSKDLYRDHGNCFRSMDLLSQKSKIRRKPAGDHENEMKHENKDKQELEYLKRDFNNLRIKLLVLYKKLDEFLVSHYEKNIVPNAGIYGIMSYMRHMTDMSFSEVFAEIISNDESIIKGLTSPKGIAESRIKRCEELREPLTLVHSSYDKNKYWDLTRKDYLSELAADTCLILQYPILSDIFEGEIMQHIEKERKEKERNGANVSLAQEEKSEAFGNYLKYKNIAEERKKIRELEMFEDLYEYHMRLGLEIQMIQKKSENPELDKGHLKRQSNELRILFYEFSKKIEEKIHDAFIERFFEANEIPLKYSGIIHRSRNYKAPYIKSVSENVEDQEESDDSELDKNTASVEQQLQQSKIISPQKNRTSESPRIKLEQERKSPIKQPSDKLQEDGATLEEIDNYKTSSYKLEKEKIEDYEQSDDFELDEKVASIEQQPQQPTITSPQKNRTSQSPRIQQERISLINKPSDKLQEDGATLGEIDNYKASSIQLEHENIEDYEPHGNDSISSIEYLTDHLNYTPIKKRTSKDRKSPRTAPEHGRFSLINQPIYEIPESEAPKRRPLRRLEKGPVESSTPKQPEVQKQSTIPITSNKNQSIKDTPQKNQTSIDQKSPRTTTQERISLINRSIYESLGNAGVARNSLRREEKGSMDNSTPKQQEEQKQYATPVTSYAEESLKMKLKQDESIEMPASIYQITQNSTYEENDNQNETKISRLHFDMNYFVNIINKN